MKILQTNVNLVYPRISDYRKKFLENENILSDEFLPASIFSLPDQVQEEVPRIITQSKNHHSELNIALTVSSLSTNYDKEYTSSWQLCRNYLKKRCESLYKIVDVLSDNKTFVGLITNIEYDNLSESGVDILQKNIFRNSDFDKPIDLQCKFTFVYKQSYYINISLSDIRDFNISIENGKRKINMNAPRNSINVILDVNDRYSANTEENYISDEKSFNNILDITSEIVQHKLSDIIEKGIYKYE